jgi:hypothetical protein
MKPHRSTIATILCLLFGPIVWATHLMTIYAAHTVLCAHGTAGSMGGGIDASVSVAAAATILALILMASAAGMVSGSADGFGPPAEQQCFLRRVMLWLTALSVLAVIWSGITAAVIPACAPLR